MTSFTKQFLSLPLAVLGTFVASAGIGVLVLEHFGCWLEPVVGPFCASTVIAVTFWLAPSQKSTCGLVVLVLGASFAWWLLRGSCYPESHPRAYQPTVLPLGVTIAAGLMSYVFWFWFWHHKQRADRRTNADECKPMEAR